jgi:hypothetical protein
MWAGPDEAEPARRDLRAEAAVEADDPEARAELPNVADARFAVALEARPPDSRHMLVQVGVVRFEWGPAAGVGVVAAPAPQPPVAMHAAGQAKAVVAAGAASPSRFAFGWAADSTRAATATRCERFPE